MSKKHVVVGFDGYIDKILKPIYKGAANRPVYFGTLKSFSSYLMEKSMNSCAIQMDLVETRLGGNAPILTKTLRNLIANVTLIGMLGDLNKDDNIFANSLKPGKNYSFMDPIETQALEFSNAKLFLSARPPKGFVFKKIMSVLPDPDIFITADLFACVNWGELDFSHKLWNQIYSKFFRMAQKNKTKHIFIDTADISRHPKKRILEFCTLLKQFSKKRYVILGVNANELKILCKTISVCNAKNLFEELKIDELLYHSKDNAQLFISKKHYIVEVKRISFPKISTGAGDNFNAGYIYALLANKDYKERLQFANACSHYYMSTGKPVKSSKTLIKYKESLYN